MFGKHALPTLLLVAAGLPTISLADPAGEKKAWQWTPEERLERRYDPARAAARRATAVADGRIAADADSILVVDGERNPELLLPHELMDRVLSAYYHHDPATSDKLRARFFGGASAWLGEDAFERLQSLMQPFIDAEIERDRLDTLRKSATGAERVSLDQELASTTKLLCPRRAEALAAARNLFGRETFDRFLYDVVARAGVVIKTSSAPERLAGTDQWLEAGCP